MRRIVYVDLDDTLCDFMSAFEKAIKDNPSIQYPQSQYRFFANLKPIDGGLDVMQTLKASDRYEPYILSAPSTRNPLSYLEKREWVETHLGYEYCKRLILCPHKGLLKGDYLIDDNVNGKGQDHFEGKLIHFGSSMYPDWHAVRNELGV